MLSHKTKLTSSDVSTYLPADFYGGLVRRLVGGCPESEKKISVKLAK